MTRPALRPCPFCGKDDFLEIDTFDENVVCDSCGARGPEGGKRAWNYRVGEGEDE